MFRFLILTLFTVFVVNPNLALAKRTAEEILSAGGTPEEIGLAIVTELDERDLGYGDLTVDVEMTLENSGGETSKREMRNKTFEITDKDRGDKTMIIFDRPLDVKGTAFLTFSNILDPDDQWLYLPSLKRVKRISSKNKSGPFVGSEFAYEDISSFEVGKYDYKYIKDEKCGDLECFVVESYPKYEYSGYTKIVNYIDKEEFRPIKAVFYDRKGDLLKTLSYNGYQQYLGKYWRADEFDMVNHQKKKSTKLKWLNYKFRTGIEESDLTKSTLKRAR